jgi:NAD(P)-dependent dehydrogenase (short-subunit alcohol dehydrogenase family)
MKSIVITGVSTGIGFAAAKLFVEKGFRVFGSVRRQTDAERLQRELGDTFAPLIFDVADEMSVKQAADTVKTALAGEPLFGLVVNAGIAVAGPLLYVKPDDFRRQLEVNLTGALITVQAFATLLIGKPPGRVVMISSVAGKTALPFNGPYAISKFGIEAFAESLRREMMPFGVDVVAVAPGPIQSAIWEKTAAIDTTPFEKTAYAPALAKIRTMMREAAAGALPASRLARVIHRALTARRPKARYVVTPDPLGYYALRILPARLADRIIAGKLGLKPSKN